MSCIAISCVSFLLSCSRPATRRRCVVAGVTFSLPNAQDISELSAAMLSVVVRRSDQRFVERAHRCINAVPVLHPSSVYIAFFVPNTDDCFVLQRRADQDRSGNGCHRGERGGHGALISQSNVFVRYRYHSGFHPCVTS